MKKTYGVIIALGLASLFPSRSASAQEEQGGRPNRGGRGGACSQDIQKHCPGMRPGSDDFRECMRSHKEELSDSCKQQIRDRMGGRADGADNDAKTPPSEGTPPSGGGACREELKKACPGLKPGSDDFRQCVRSHLDQLSDECKQQLKARAGGNGRPSAKEENGGGGPCAAETRELCPGMKPGDGHLMQCLHEHQDKLSSGCREKIQGIVKARVQDAAQACQADIGVLCADAKGDPRAAVKCLRERSDGLSDGCKKAMRSLRPGH